MIWCVCLSNIYRRQGNGHLDEIKKLRKFDNSKKNYEDRKEHVEKVLSEVKVDEVIRDCLDLESKTYGRLEDYLDDLGTYLLESSDIDSCRNIEDSFYRNDKYYNTSTAMGKNSMYIDLQEETWGNMFPNEIHNDELNEEYIFRLFDEDNLTQKDKRNLLRIGVSEIKNIHNEHLRNEIENFFDSQINKVRSGKDLLVINYLAKGLNDSEIAEKLKVSRPAISKRFKKITK